MTGKELQQIHIPLCRGPRQEIGTCMNGKCCICPAQVPSFMEVFMIVERTARHNEFYEKFNCRYLIGMMLGEL